MGTTPLDLYQVSLKGGSTSSWVGVEGKVFGWQRRLRDRAGLAIIVVRRKVLASGKVQIVNYRQRASAEAQRRGLAGTIENDAKDRRKVRIVVQGAQAEVDSFLTAIRVPEGESIPRNVRVVQELNPDPSLTDFEILYKDTATEVVERINLAGEALTSLGEKVESGLGRVGTELQTVGSRTSGIERAVEEGNARAAQFHEGLIGAVLLTDKKYGMIGDSLGSIEKALGRQTRATEKQTAALILLAKRAAQREPPTPARARRPAHHTS